MQKIAAQKIFGQTPQVL